MSNIDPDFTAWNRKQARIRTIGWIVTILFFAALGIGALALLAQDCRTVYVQDSQGRTTPLRVCAGYAW